MPGLLTFVVWLGIVMIVKLIIKQNYIPYSLIFFSAIIQLVLIFAMMSSVNATIAKRLLATNIKGQR
jgi:phosphate starvation-inducible membrane PsiE